MTERIEMKCLEVARNRRTCAGMDAASKRIAELESEVEKWQEYWKRDADLYQQTHDKFEAFKQAVAELPVAVHGKLGIEFVLKADVDALLEKE